MATLNQNPDRVPLSVLNARAAKQTPRERFQDSIKPKPVERKFTTPKVPADTKRAVAAERAKVSEYRQGAADQRRQAAEDKAAQARAFSERADAEQKRRTQKLPTITGATVEDRNMAYANQSTKMQAPRMPLTNSRGQTRRRSGVPLGVLNARLEKQGSGTTFKEMDVETYEGLDAKTRGAVDANTLLQQAISKDRGLVDELDANKDGYVSVKEADTAGGTANYRGNYESVFGKGAPDERLNFAPNTVAALGAMGVAEKGGKVEDYLSGRNLVTEQDMAAGYTKQDGPGRRAEPDGRRARVTQLSGKMTALQDTLAAGRSVLLANADRAQLGTMIDSLREGMMAGAKFDQLSNGTGFNMSSLADEDYRARTMAIEDLYTQMQNAGLSELDMQDDAYISEVLAGNGLNNLDEWKAMLKKKQAGISTEAEAYQSTAGNR